MVKQVGKYEIGDKLGSGSYAEVKKATHVDTREVFAIKIIDRQKLHQENMEEQLRREIAVMKNLKHEHVVNLKEVMVSSNRIYLVMELIEGGELVAKLKAEKQFDEDVARRYFQQLVFGLDYCHRQGIAHRDLKPQNLLLDKNDNIKIADFGLANMQDANANTASLMTACGSPQYVAPEVLSESGYNGHLADVWSCGIILYYMLAGTLPFNDTNQNGLFMKIQRGQYRMSSAFSDEAKDLISKILVVDPTKRITLDEIQKHEWFLGGADGGAAVAAEAAKLSAQNMGLKGVTVSDENLRNAVTNEEEKEK